MMEFQMTFIIPMDLWHMTSVAAISLLRKDQLSLNWCNRAMTMSFHSSLLVNVELGKF